jgi:hypothetical protein
MGSKGELSAVNSQFSVLSSQLSVKGNGNGY